MEHENPGRPNAADLSHYWMPLTANRQFKSDPRLLVSAQGMFYRSAGGRDILDGTAGLCVNAGHGRAQISQAAERQLMTMDYAPSFQMGHLLAFDFAKRLATLAPNGLDRIFFTNSGSESVDTALKIAIAYHRSRGEGHRVRLIGRERGYHGVGFGGLSVGGIVNNRRVFPQLPAIGHLPHTHGIPENRFSRGQPEKGAYLADEIERLVALHGDETIAAVIVEPVACSGGVLIPPKGYLERLRELCTRHRILLIFDEVITGFGRLGTPFAAQYFGVTPDMMTTAKAITNGAIPMGAVFVARDIHDSLMKGPEQTIELFHGYTYSGHPVGCAVGLAVMNIYEEEKLLTRAASVAKIWEQAVHALHGLPHVIDIRNLGLIAAVELEGRPGAPGERGYDAMVRAFQFGVMVRVTGDTLAMSPPLIIEEAQIDQLFGTVRTVLGSLQ